MSHKPGPACKIRTKECKISKRTHNKKPAASPPNGVEERKRVGDGREPLVSSGAATMYGVYNDDIIILTIMQSRSGREKEKGCH